jgi:hypothetical protein
MRGPWKWLFVGYREVSMEGHAKDAARTISRLRSRLMSLIKPRTRGKRLVRLKARLDWQTNETLYAYARFIGESTEYVLNQVIDTVLAKDKDFVQWRAANPGSFVPQINRRRRDPPARQQALRPD